MSLASDLEPNLIFGIRCRRRNDGSLEIVLPFQYYTKIAKVNKTKNEEMAEVVSKIPEELIARYDKFSMSIFRKGRMDTPILKIKSMSEYQETYLITKDDEDGRIILDNFFYNMAMRKTQLRGKLANYWNIDARNVDYTKRVERLTPLRNRRLSM